MLLRTLRYKLSASFHSLLVFIILVVTFSSCINAKKAAYFPGLNDGVISARTPVPESVIQKNDILSIYVTSPNPEATKMYNNPAANSGPFNQMNSNMATDAGYLVNTEGNITFPGLGLVKAEGLTKLQLEQKISSVLLERKLAVEPMVNVRFLNFRVTVLGEVNRAGVVTMPNEKISLLEALGLAGDLTIYGSREDVMVIREENNQKVIKRINLNSAELLSSPYYYLKSNDIVYVTPNKAKVASTSRSSQWLPIVFSGLSFAAILADRLIN